MEEAGNSIRNWEGFWNKKRGGWNCWKKLEIECEESRKQFIYKIEKNRIDWKL